VTRLLGIDLGRRRIGVAVSDEAAATARPLVTLGRGVSPSADADAIARIAAEQRVAELVVGLPLHLDGSVGSQAEETRAWAGSVAAQTGLPVTFRDERLTTDRASERIGPPPRGRAGGPPTAEQRRSRNARLDREAATLILQAELDARRSAVA
jgi:putative Holliday junction resolvase